MTYPWVSGLPALPATASLFSSFPMWGSIHTTWPDATGAESPLQKPSQISGLIAWYDATQITDGISRSSLGTWTDLSGNAFHMVNSLVTQQPLYVTGEINGLPAVSFGSAGRHLLRAVMTGSAMTAGTIFLTMKPYFSAGEGTAHAVISRTRNSATSTLYDLEKRSVANRADWSIRCNSTQNDCQVTNFSFSTNDTVYWAVDYDISGSAASMHFFNKSSRTSTGGGSNLSVFESGATVNVGTGDGALFSSNLSASIGEMIFYDRLLTANEQKLVNNYMTNKWSPT